MKRKAMIDAPKIEIRPPTSWPAILRVTGTRRS